MRAHEELQRRFIRARERARAREREGERESHRERSMKEYERARERYYSSLYLNPELINISGSLRETELLFLHYKSFHVFYRESRSLCFHIIFQREEKLLLYRSRNRPAKSPCRIKRHR